MGFSLSLSLSPSLFLADGEAIDTPLKLQQGEGVDQKEGIVHMSTDSIIGSQARPIMCVTAAGVLGLTGGKLLILAFES